MYKNFRESPQDAVVGLPIEEHEECHHLHEEEMCSAQCEGYGCTLAKGHTGRHVAHGVCGQAWATWEDADESALMPWETGYATH